MGEKRLRAEDDSPPDVATRVDEVRVEELERQERRREGRTSEESVKEC